MRRSALIPVWLALALAGCQASPAKPQESAAAPWTAYLEYTDTQRDWLVNACLAEKQRTHSDRDLAGWYLWEPAIEIRRKVARLIEDRGGRPILEVLLDLSAGNDPLALPACRALLADSRPQVRQLAERRLTQKEGQAVKEGGGTW